MDCQEDLIFNDDNCRNEDKTKESLLLMKKKMLRSHELILQYNNKLKECERLKGDLGIVQEEAKKLKRENNTNLSKVIKLELQSAEQKKYREDLEKRLADKDVQIAGDKCHLQQLICKVEDIEDKHSEKLMEIELQKSSLEGKVKSLEQELKALRKSHATEVAKLEKAASNLPPKTKKGPIKFVRETNEIGVNTIEEIEPARTIKHTTVDKCTMTNEFYHITDNPYPIFCDKCESLTQPSVEKICKIMSSCPPIVTEMISPIRHRETPRADVSRNCSKFNESDLNVNNVNRNEFRRVEPISRNFVSPIDPTISNVELPSVPRALDTSNSEIENLRRKLETLERKIKKRKKQKNLDAQPGNANCCSHSRSVNCCGFGQSPLVNPVPNVFNNPQTDMMTEFWNRLMKFTNERAPKIESPRKPKKRTKVKLRRLKKCKIRKKKNCGSATWDIESNNCEANNVDDSETNHSHILRIKPTDVELEECSPVKNQSNENDEFTEEETQIENSSNRAAPVKVPDKPKNKRRKRVLQFSDDEDDTATGIVSLKNEVIENHAQTSNLEFPTMETEDLVITAGIPNSLDADLSNSRISENLETANFSQKSISNGSRSISHAADSRDTNFKTALPTDECVSDARSISRNSEPYRALSNRRSDRSVSVYSDADISDAPNDETFDTDVQDSSLPQKRRRTNSPKPTRRSTRSNLLGKLRALKKNSIKGVANTQNSSCHETRYQLRLRHESEAEDNEGKTRETSSVSESDPDPRLPVKKQRIAHVPKNDNALEEQENPEMEKLRQVAKQICQNPKRKRGRPPTRHLKLNQLKSSSPVEPPRTTETAVASSEVPEATLDRKLNDSSLPKASDAESPYPKPVTNGPAKVDGVLKKRAKIVKSIVKDNPDNKTKIEISENKKKVPKSAEKKITESSATFDAICDGIDKSTSGITSETTQNDIPGLATLDSEKGNCNTLKTTEQTTIAKESSRETDQNVEISKSIADQSAECSTPRETNDLTAACVPPTVTSEIDSPASPASNASLEIPQSSPIKILLSPTRSPVKSPQISLQAESPDEKTSTNTATIGNSLDTTDLPKSFPNFTKSILFDKLTEEPAQTKIHSNNVVPPVTIPDKIAVSDHPKDKTRPVSSHKLPAVIVPRRTSNLKVVKRRSVTNDNVLVPAKNVANANTDAASSSTSSLPDNLATGPEETKNVMLDDSNSKISTTAPSASISSKTDDGPIDKPSISDKVEENLSVPGLTKESGRELVIYDANLHEDFDSTFETGSVSSPKAVTDVAAVTAVTSKTKKKKKKKGTKNSLDNSVGANNVVKALRSRKVLNSPAIDANQDNPLTTKDISDDETNQSTESLHRILSPETMLKRHMTKTANKSKVRIMRKTAAMKLQETTEKNVKAELDKLVESEEWTNELHQSVIIALREVPSKRSVAKCIVELLAERAALTEPLDRTHTPPAPVMTKTQQRIAALISSLDRDEMMCGISELVQKGIKYKLCRFGHIPEIEVLEGLVRMFTAMARVQKDRERVRILCCDFFYCLGKRAHSVINVVLTVWPEVFPMHGTIEGEIPNCIAHLIKCDTHKRAAAAKRLIENYYMYPQFQARTGAVMTGLLQALKNNYSSDLEAAILLLAKAEGVDWTRDNIVNGGLMTIINDNNYPSSYNALSLLGFILKTFPFEDPGDVVRKVVDQLFKLIESDEATPDQEEGVISALLSLSRRSFFFIKIADTVLNWKPSQTLRPRTKEQLNAFFKMKPPAWWKERNRLREIKNNMAQQNK